MSEIFKLYNYIFDSRKYLLEMLEDRGYDVSHLKDYTHDEMNVMINEHNNGKFRGLAEVGPLDIVLEKKSTSLGIGIDKTSDKTIDEITTSLNSIKLEDKQKLSKDVSTEKIYVKYRLDPKFKKTASLTEQITDIFTNLLTTKDTLIILNVCRVLMKAGVKDKTDEEFGNNLFVTKKYFVQLFGLENFLFNVSRHQFVPKHRILSKKETHDLLEKYNCNITNIPTIKRDDVQAKYIGLRPHQICEITVDNVTSGNTVRYRLCVTN